MKPQTIFTPKLALCFVLVLWLSACGQSGKLYLPHPVIPIIVTPPPAQEVGHRPLPPSTSSLRP